MLRAASYLLALLWINVYICRDMFFASTTYMGSMHGFWTALATRAGGSWFHATWWPFWDNGIPFESTYPAAWCRRCRPPSALLRGSRPRVGFHSVTGVFLYPRSLYALDDGLEVDACTRYSFLAALAYSLTSVREIGPNPSAKFLQ